MRAIDWRKDDDAVTVTFRNIEITNLDLVQQIGVELMEVAVIAQGAARLTIDLRGVEVMSSAMLGKLVLLNKKAKAMSVKLNFCNPSPSVYELLNRYGRGGSGPAQPA